MKLIRANFLQFLVIASLLPFAACKSGDKDAAAKGASGKPKMVAADAYVAHPQAFSNTYTASGSLLPNEEVAVHPEMSGRVTGLFFKEGNVVRKGQLLVQLYDADLRAQLQRLQAQRKLQSATENRQRELLGIGGISKQDYETTQAQTKYVDADIAAAEAALSKMRIVAPFDGTIGLRSISVGAVVSPTTTVATLQQINPLKMDFSIPDQYRSFIRLGSSVQFSVDGIQDTLSGSVSAVEPGADAMTRTIRIRAVVPNGKGQLTSGAFAHVIIPFTSSANAILIPSQCIIPTTRDKKVAVVRDGKAALVTVLIGNRTADKVEVTQGVQSGDTILVTALMQVKPGMDIKVKRVIN